MPTKKGNSEFELNDIDCCALDMAMLESRKVELMLLPLLRHKTQEAFRLCREKLSGVFGNSKSNPFILDISSDEGMVCKAYIEREIARLLDLVGEDRNMRLRCRHTVAVHLGALTEIWKLFPKEKEQ
ncbi:MAG: hypothetical protein Q7S09_05270 [bacterium]|nr:hypothetical protein [bacterium]